LRLRKIRNLIGFTVVTFVVFGALGLLAFGYVFHVAYWLYPPSHSVMTLAEDSPFQRITVTTEDNLTLTAWYTPPQNGQAILMFHGHSANRDQHMPHADYLLEAGYGLLMLDFRNHGESEGERTSMGFHEIKDARAAYQYLVVQDDVEQIIIWGHSMGGAVASQLMSEVDASGLFIDATFGDFPSIVRAGVVARGFSGSPFTEILTTMYGLLSGADWNAVRPVDYLADVDKPILLFHGAYDGVIPVAEGYRLADINPNIRLVIFEEGAHSNLFQVDPMLYQAEVMAYLESIPAPQETAMSQ